MVSENWGGLLKENKKPLRGKSLIANDGVEPSAMDYEPIGVPFPQFASIALQDSYVSWTHAMNYQFIALPLS